MNDKNMKLDGLVRELRVLIASVKALTARVTSLENASPERHPASAVDLGRQFFEVERRSPVVDNSGMFSDVKEARAVVDTVEDDETP